MRVMIRKMAASEDLEAVYAVRRQVFVVEQKVPEEEEIDAHEQESHHFAALVDGKVVGAARWRLKDGKAKLERFAVLEAYRCQGVGTELIRAVLADIRLLAPKCSQYLHAQIPAVSLYERFGFAAKGEQFDECGIMHYAMHRPADPPTDQ